jgi:hypothetical protein
MFVPSLYGPATQPFAVQLASPWSRRHAGLPDILFKPILYIHFESSRRGRNCVVSTGGVCEVS